MKHLKFFNIHGTETKCLQKEIYSSPVDFRTGRQTGHSGDFCSVTAFLVIQERTDWKIPRFLHYFLYLMEETYMRKDLVDSQNQKAQSECLGRDSEQRSFAVFLTSQWIRCREGMQPLGWLSPFLLFSKGPQSVELHHLMTNI